MSSASEPGRLACAFVAVAAALLVSATPRPNPREAGTLRVCADPNNLPFSNDRGQGFENRLAELLAADLGKKVTYTFWPQRRGFIRNTLRAGTCDVVMGIPAAFDLVRPTAAYYRSTYVFVTRRDRALAVRSFDDPRLRALRIGIHVIGDDYANVPPAEALARRGMVGNIRGYPIYGDYSDPDPPRGLIDAVARGDIDVAIAWGPTAGYFARQEPVPLTLTNVSPGSDTGPTAMVFDIAMGVRRGDDELQRALDRALVAHRRDVQRLLQSYGVPLVAGRAKGTAEP
jgi:mxaJ protein